MLGYVPLGLWLFIASIAGAWAQNYPAKPVRILVGYAAGGSIDIVGRILGQKLGEYFGQQFVVDNRPGAASNIAADLVAKSAPDGYTLLVSSSGSLGTNLAIYSKMPYDPLKDLTPIAMLVHQGNVLVVNLSVPSKTVKEFIALARAKPGQLNYGSGGNGSSQHMSTELFQNATGVKMVHVPYKGGAPALADLIGGQIDLIFAPAPEAIPYVKNGRVRALGVTTSKRSIMLPDIPTIAEAGVPGYDFDGWMGIAGPAHLPRDLVMRLNGEVNKALAANDVKTRLQDLGLELAGGTPEQLGTYMREQSAKMIKLAKDAGIKPVD
jgi:tripartite-type tricarboxylate transporter receptor subunit TctC